MKTEKAHSVRLFGLLACDNGGTTKDGPGSAPTLWFRGLADCEGVD